MANFSGAIKLADLNDFIAPSQACVVKVEGGKLSEDLELDGQVVLQPRSKAQGFSQTVPSGPDGSIKVTLNDCLACSGCVTSAETVLLEHQSSAELLERLADPSLTVIVSVSPQSRASLATFLGLEVEATFKKLTHFLHDLGVSYVFDTSASRDISLLETAREFTERYRASHAESAAGTGQPALNSGSCRADSIPGVQHSLSRSTGTFLPQLASACPGWVCYAEKTHGDYILPYISTAKSPQAVMGSIVKGPLCKRLGLQPHKIYHCAIMPCYDKKLEASRDDFLAPGSAESGQSVPETDCVLTSGELQALALSSGVDLAVLPEAPIDSLLCPADAACLHGWPGGSGGYLDFVFRTAARELFDRTLPPGPLPMRMLRNTDFQETCLEVEGRVVLRFAAAYGFRNIQTLMRQIKRNVCKYDYVEIMACPSGCLNGGGQVKQAGGQSATEVLDALDQRYHSLRDVDVRTPQESPLLQSLYEEWVGDGPYSAAAQDLLHTRYHHRSKPLQATLNDW